MVEIAVVIPAYNEETTIASVVDAVLETHETVIVVNDASTDSTSTSLNGKPIRLVNLPQNFGKAGALSVGFDEATKMGANAVITMDGDGQHEAKDIVKFLAAARKYPNALVIGSRETNTEQAPKARLFANKFANFWISWASGMAISDSQCGFRLYPLAIIQRLRLKTDKSHSFVFESEVVIEACRNGFELVSVPIRSYYPENRRKSHFRPIIDIARITQMVALKLLARGLYIRGLINALNGQPKLIR